MAFWELTDHFIVAAPLERAWAFFGSAENLARITPPWLRFRVDTPPPVRVGPAALIDYTIRWMGLPVRWRTKILDWEPPRRFVDVQIRGPYAMWHHQHTFAEGPGGVECRDRVIYSVPPPLVGPAVHRLVVRRQLLDIFRFRRRVIGEALGWVHAVQPDVEIRRL